MASGWRGQDIALDKIYGVGVGTIEVEINGAMQWRIFLTMVPLLCALLEQLTWNYGVITSYILAESIVLRIQFLVDDGLGACLTGLTCLRCLLCG